METSSSQSWSVTGQEVIKWKKYYSGVNCEVFGHWKTFHREFVKPFLFKILKN